MWDIRPEKGVMLRSTPADYDTITIRFEVNGHVEPLTDPHVRLHIYADVLLTETQILIVVVLGFLPIPSTVAISCG